MAALWRQQRISPAISNRDIAWRRAVFAARTDGNLVDALGQTDRLALSGNLTTRRYEQLGKLRSNGDLIGAIGVGHFRDHHAIAHSEDQLRHRLRINPGGQ